MTNLDSVVSLLALTGLCIGGVQDAHATKTITSPYVQKDKWELEWKASHDYDHSRTKAGKEVQKLGLMHGFTNRFSSEVALEITENPGYKSDYKLTTAALENKVQLTEKGEYWMDAGLRLDYEQSFKNNTANKLSTKLLLSKEMGQTTHTANIKLYEEVGLHANGGVGRELSWGSKYRLNPAFQPGFEYYGDFGRFNQRLHYSQEKHQIGPVFYGKLPHGFTYDIGYLFGASRAAPDGMLKTIVKYAF